MLLLTPASRSLRAVVLGCVIPMIAVLVVVRNAFHEERRQRVTRLYQAAGIEVRFARESQILTSDPLVEHSAVAIDRDGAAIAALAALPGVISLRCLARLQVQTIVIAAIVRTSGRVKGGAAIPHQGLIALRTYGASPQRLIRVALHEAWHVHEHPRGSDALARIEWRSRGWIRSDGRAETGTGQGDPPDGFVSHYATRNEWEDRAETFVADVTWPLEDPRRSGIIQDKMEIIRRDLAACGCAIRHGRVVDIDMASEGRKGPPEE